MASQNLLYQFCLDDKKEDALRILSLRNVIEGGILSGDYGDHSKLLIHTKQERGGNKYVVFETKVPKNISLCKTVAFKTQDKIYNEICQLNAQRTQTVEGDVLVEFHMPYDPAILKTFINSGNPFSHSYNKLTGEEAYQFETNNMNLTAKIHNGNIKYSILSKSSRDVESLDEFGDTTSQVNLEIFKLSQAE